jgi:hypothetical protein
MKIIILIFMLLLFSCGNNNHEKPKEQSETAIHEEQQYNEDSVVIELNNEEKWKVDANMLAHIRTMENSVVSFANEDPKDFKTLTKKLQSNLDLLTSNCTMTGKAHDELHKWLLPYIDMVNQLSKAKDETESAKHFKKIEHSFITFNQYFQ